MRYAALNRLSSTLALSAVVASTLVGCAQVADIERTDVERLLLLDVGNVPQNSVDPLWYAAVSAGLLLWPQDSPVEQQDIVLTAAQVKQLPFAASYFRLNEQPQILSILAFANRVGDDPSAVRLHWATQFNEVAETDAVGRLLSLETAFSQPSASYFAGNNAALGCFAKAAQGLTDASTCPQQGQWAYDMTALIDNSDETARAQSYDYRQSAPVNYELVSTSVQLAMPDGTSVSAWHVREQASDGSFSNDFYLDPRNGKSLKARQWLGSALGYFESQQVQLWATPARAAGADNTKVPAPLAVMTPMGAVQVAPGARMAALYDNLKQASSSAELFPPLVRVHSCELQQKLDARKAGMLVRLRLLQQTYRADGNEQGLRQAEALEQQFSRWPLKATYLHGFSLPQSRFDLALNPKLPLSDAQQSCPLSLVLGIPQAARSVGLTDSSQNSAWVIRSDGEMSRLELANARQREQNQRLLQQPNSIVYYGIDEADLPAGFKDLNQQMSLFLQHWDFAHGN